MIIGHLTTAQIEDIGMDLFVQCVTFKAEDKLENPYVTVTLNVLGVMYSVQVPKLEANDPENIKAAWSQLIKDFGVFHMLGQSRRIQDGNRELNEVEISAIEAAKAKRARKEERKLKLVDV